jgi:multiple sugar transport system substrate-binding protein
MFYKPKNALYKSISRRKFLELGGSAALTLGAGSLAVGLNSVIVRRPVQAASSDDAKWRQYDGSKLVFMSENTPPSFAIRDNIKAFHDLTGITVEILTDDLPVVQQKIGIDLRGGKADFQLNYVQDKPIGSPFADFFEDLTPYLTDETLPQIKDGYGKDVWFENFLDTCGHYYDGSRLVALPYDSAVSVMFYRKDLFDKYSKDFEKEYGHPLEYTDNTTWKNVYEFAKFFTEMHKKDESVPYGYGQHHGSFGWTTQLDIQRMLYSHGKWLDFKIDDILGSKKPGPTNWGDAQSIEVMKRYKEQAGVSHPDNLAVGTLELNTVYAAGKIAMQCQYHEFAASVEDEKNSNAAGGKTGYGLCPKGEKSWVVGGGDVVNGVNCGIGGIGINGGASKDLKRAAYIFSIWATSQDTQLMVLKGVGGTPTRKSVVEISEVKAARNRPTKMPNALTFEAVYDKGIKAPNLVMGPKIPKANEYHDIVRVGAQKCVAGEMSPEEACNSIRDQLNEMHGV